jgi:phospholipid-binding lipoprotein MlaA
MRRSTLLCCSALLLVLAGCATPPNDPLEPLNRKTFTFNQGVDRIVLKPIAKGYRRAIPQGGRDGIRNFLRNIHEPVVLVNNLLQGEFKRAGTTLGRFLANSTVGVAGVMDFASRHGLKRQTGDFGQTLYVWGVHEGPYLVLPLLGPSSPRDAIGISVDLFTNPVVYVTPRFKYKTSVSAAETVIGGIDERSRNIETLDEVQRETIDFYAALRSLYRQDRAADLRHGEPPPAPKVEDLYNDPGDTPPAGH